MDVERQKLRKNYDFTLFIATLSHEMDVEGQKLGKNCDFTGPVSVCKSFCVQKLLCLKASLCKSVCV